MSVIATAGRRQLCEALKAIGRHELVAPVESGDVTAVFSFGSNNVEQLRARLRSDALVAVPACVPSHQLIFSGPNTSWSLGGRLENVAVASLRFAPDEPASRALGNCGWVGGAYQAPRGPHPDAGWLMGGGPPRPRAGHTRTQSG